MAGTTEHEYRHTQSVCSVPKENCEGPKIYRFNSTINFILHSTETPSPRVIRRSDQQHTQTACRALL